MGLVWGVVISPSQSQLVMVMHQQGLLVSNSDRQSGGIQLSEVQCSICLRQHAARSGGFIRTEKIGQYYFGERWKGLLMGQSIPTHCGGWRFQVPTGKG